MTIRQTIHDPMMQYRSVLASAKTRARTAKGICDALNKVIGLPAFEEENIGNMVERGDITLCSDGVIAWDDDLPF